MSFPQSLYVATGQSWHALCNRDRRLRESGAEPRNRYGLCGLGGMTTLIFDVTNPKRVGDSTMKKRSLSGCVRTPGVRKPRFTSLVHHHRWRTCSRCLGALMRTQRRGLAHLTSSPESELVSAEAEGEMQSVDGFRSNGRKTREINATSTWNGL